MVLARVPMVGAWCPITAMKTLKYFATVLAIAIVSGFTTTARAEAPKPGAAAPDFSLTDLEGKSHTLASLKGKLVVLEWNNFGCPFVERLYNDGVLPELQKKYTGAGVVWLAVNSKAPDKDVKEATAKMKETAEKSGFAGTAYAFDEGGKVSKAYAAPSTPTLVVIDKEGTLQYWGALDDKPQGGEGAKNYVAAALDALIAGKAVEIQTTKPYGCGVKY